ncbi:MAG: hypothetical protein Q8R36_00440 [bacterium]|nr:hypothetical protein [bacterium]
MLVPVLGPLWEDRDHRIIPWRPSDEEYAIIGQSVPIVCTDLVFVDSLDRFVLAYRKNACARGWWWMGGSLKAGMTMEESVGRIMVREIGWVPKDIKLLCVLQHFWSERGEKPHEFGRHDIMFVHFIKVSEDTLAKIRLDPKEYEPDRGFLRYDGTQQVRDAVAEVYRLYQDYVYQKSLRGMIRNFIRKLF